MGGMAADFFIGRVQYGVGKGTLFAQNECRGIFNKISVMDMRRDGHPCYHLDNVPFQLPRHIGVVFKQRYFPVGKGSVRMASSLQKGAGQIPLARSGVEQVKSCNGFGKKGRHKGRNGGRRHILPKNRLACGQNGGMSLGNGGGKKLEHISS